MVHLFVTPLLLFILFLGSATAIFAYNYPQKTPNIITTDIDNFWTAYDKIVMTKDNAEQLEYLNKFFIEKGTIGLKAMMIARRYTAQEYVDAINKRPEYWNSIRANTLQAEKLGNELSVGIEKLRKIYPVLKPANIYFTVGVFRSGGTTDGNNILIGSEIMFANQELMDNLVFLNIHEYVHTQQKNAEDENLYQRSVKEGIAEFVTVKALEKPSTTPAIDFGKHNEPRIKNAFALQMFNLNYGFWFYSDAKNEFNTRDLGYYVGYAIAEKYYEKAKNKILAIKEMIELDPSNLVMMAKYVDSTGYFPKSVKKLEKEYEKNRPQVLRIKEFKNGDKKVSPSLTQLTIEFSEEMEKPFRSFNFGPLGIENFPKIKNFLGFAEDNKSILLEIEPLQPNRRYQIEIGNSFRDKLGIRLKPYLINFTTADK